MNFIPPDFHFLRPLWGLAALPALLLVMATWRAPSGSGRWERAIDRTLLPHLLDGRTTPRRKWPVLALLLAWLLTVLGLAGPVWEKLPQAVQKKADALVIIQDLSLSLYAKDLSPNRLTRAHHKLLDLLQARKEGTTALVVYAGDAHVVTPLTDDITTIAAMVPELTPAIMPSYGSNLSAAVALALQLFRDTTVSRGKLLLLTDEVTGHEAEEVAALLRGKNVVLSVLAVGTADGGPIPTGDGGFLRDDAGNIVIPRLDGAALRNLAAGNGGRYSDIKLDDSDIRYLLGAEPVLPDAGEYRQIDRQYDQWQEQGHWLVLLALPLALLAFRRGWLIGLVIILAMWSRESQAMGWQDLWLRKDQQAARALAANEPARAAALFKQPPWRGVAEYRAGNYPGAVEAFSEKGSTDDHYNRGNALARAGKLEAALRAYDQALQLEPEMADATFNRELVAKLLQEQAEQDRQQQQDKNGEQQQEGGDDIQSGEAPEEQQAGQGQEGQQDKAEQAPSKQGDEAARDSDKSSRKDSGDQSAEKGGSREEGGEESPSQPAAEPRDQQKDGGDNGVGEQLSGEEQQALEQWLRQIPDEPGGLLRRKFEYEFQQGKNRKPPPAGKIW